MQRKPYHIAISSTDIAGATMALLPGDPARVDAIAQLLTETRALAHHREYRSILGYLGKTPVVICSTGIGGPALSICVEELAQIGVRTFVRTGTCGAIQANIAVGDVIITQAAIRLDGTSHHFLPPEFPAVAHSAVLSKMLAAAKAITSGAVHCGITVTSDTFYPGQERYDTFRKDVLPKFAGSLAHWQRLGALNFEMEAAPLFAICQNLGLRAGCVTGVVASRTSSETVDQGLVAMAAQNAARLAVEALRQLNVD